MRNTKKGKPDFADLDKDGNKKEPMKAAAKTAKLKARKKPFAKNEEANEEKKKGVDGKACWKGYKQAGTKKKGGKTVDNCVPVKKAKKKKKQVNENFNISAFINCVLEKNYSEANKYLTDILTSKMQQRIESELSTPLF
jgi:hypothetical protein